MIIALGGALLALDFYAGPDIRFPIFYVFPVMLAAWRFDFRTAAKLAVAMTVMRFLFNWAWGFPQGLVQMATNILIQLVSLLMVAYLSETIAGQDRMLRQRVRELEGLLPLCQSCDTIRTEAGQWQSLDSYAATEAKPRPLCPTCSEKEAPF